MSSSTTLLESTKPDMLAEQRQLLRQKLPGNLDTWRAPGPSREHEENIWRILDPVFRDAGFTLWPNVMGCILQTPNATYPLTAGFSYATPARPNPDLNGNPIGTVERLRLFYYTNPLSRVARTPEGHDVVVRVLVIGREGYDHLKILKKLATGRHSLCSNNHTLLMFAEFQFEDVIFGLFPKVGATMRDAYGFWAKNSVGDIIDMVMQMLEWHPESLVTMKISPSRPRVYLIDFEVAVEFPPECPAEQRVSTGFPLGGSCPAPEMYTRYRAPEFFSGSAYSPFKLDIWQLGISLSNFKSTIPAIDEVLLRMTAFDPANRLEAQETLDELATIVNSMSPQSLLIPPFVFKPY